MHIYDVHTWGDDFSQYINEAKNIANGVPYYQSDYIFNPLNPEYGPPQYPPGFPLLIAPIVKVYGITFKPLFLFISACLACLIFVLYHFFRHHTKSSITAICLSVMCVYCGGVLEFKANILSDIPCWLFTALYFTLRQNKAKGNVKLLLLVLAANMAILIRTQAMLILAAEGVFLLLEQIKLLRSTQSFSIKRLVSSFSFKIITFSSILFLALHFIVFNAPDSSMVYYKNLLQFHQSSWGDAVEYNAYYLFLLLIRVFEFYPWQEDMYRLISKTTPYAIFIFSLFGFLRFGKKSSSHGIIFYILSIALLVVLSQQQGIRFILYILPFYLLYAYFFLKHIWDKIFKINGLIIGVVFTLLFLKTGKDDFRMAKQNVPDTFIPTNTEDSAFAYIKSNIDNDDVIIFAKPRLLSLFTEKKAIVHAPQHSLEMNKEHFEALNIQYALTTEKVPDEFLKNYLSKYYPDAPKKEIASGYFLYKIGN